jgi:hypothetical protein
LTTLALLDPKIAEHTRRAQRFEAFERAFLVR